MQEDKSYRIYSTNKLRSWEKAGILDGYEVICQPNACDYCKSYEGKHKFSEKLVLPPFQPHCNHHKGCGCYLKYNWNYGK